MTTFFSSIVMRELDDLRALLGGLLVRMHEGRRDELDLLARQLEIVGGEAWVSPASGLQRRRSINAALRVNIGSSLISGFDNGRTLLLSLQVEFALQQAIRRIASKLRNDT